MTFYVKTNEADFDKIMKSYLVKKGLHESKTMPVTFIFISEFSRVLLSDRKKQNSFLSSLDILA